MLTMHERKDREHLILNDRYAKQMSIDVCTKEISIR